MPDNISKEVKVVSPKIIPNSPRRLEGCPVCEPGTRFRTEIREVEAFGVPMEVEIGQCGGCFEFFVIELHSYRPV